MISAAIGLFDWPALVRFYRIQEGEFVVCVTAMLGVVTLGALQGIGLAIGLAMLVLLIRSSRPGEAVLGRVEGLQGFHDVAQHEGASVVPGLVLYRFSASVIFYNAPYFKRRVLAIAHANPSARMLIVDGAPILHLDSTGADTIVELKDELAALGDRARVRERHAAGAADARAQRRAGTSRRRRPLSNAPARRAGARVGAGDTVSLVPVTRSSLAHFRARVAESGASAGAQKRASPDACAKKRVAGTLPRKVPGTWMKCTSWIMLIPQVLAWRERRVPACSLVIERTSGAYPPAQLAWHVSGSLQCGDWRK